MSEELAIGTTSGVAVTRTLSVPCYTGHELRGVAVADAVVEARRGSAGAFTNIETTPISLSAWHGTVQSFELRVTPATVTTHVVHSFEIEAGPA